MEKINQHECNEPQAVELGKIDALDRLRCLRARCDLVTGGRGLAHWVRACRRVARMRRLGRAAQEKIRATSRSARSGPGPSVSGLVARPNEMDRVPPRAQSLQVVGDRQSARLVATGGLGARRISSSSGTRDSSLNPTR